MKRRLLHSMVKEAASAQKLIGILVCVMILMLCVSPAYAHDNESSKLDLDQYVNYANEVLSDAANFPDVDFDLDDLYISQPIEILNDNDDSNYAFFVFSQSSCVGELVVGRYSNEFNASFLQKDIPAIWDAYVAKTPIYLFSVSNSLLMCTGASAVAIVGEDVVNDAGQDINALLRSTSIENGIEGEILHISPVLMSSVYSTGIPNSLKTLNVPYVENNTINGVGICWAASAAAMVRFLTGNTVVTATSLYNTVLTDTGWSSGTNAVVLYGLSAYGVYGYTAIDDSLPFLSVVNQINEEYPVYIAINGKNVDSNGNEINVYHAVVICGYMNESDGTDYYQIMDPNISSGKVWITINRNSNAFTYTTPSYGTYTGWYRSVYSSLS